MTHWLGKFKTSLEVIVLGGSVLFSGCGKPVGEVGRDYSNSSFVKEESYDNLYNKEVMEELTRYSIIEKDIPPTDKDGNKNINLIRPQNMIEVDKDVRVKDEAKKYIDKYGTGNTGVRVLEKEKAVIEVEEKISRLIDPTKYPLIIQGQLALEFEFAKFSHRFYPYAFYARNGVHGPFQTFLHMIYRKNAISFDNLSDLEEKISKLDVKGKKIVFPPFVNHMGEVISHDEYLGYLKMKERGDVDLGDLENIHFGVISDNGLGGIEACGGKMKDLSMVAIPTDKAYGSGGGIILGLKSQIREFTFSPSCISTRLFQGISYPQLGALSKSLEIVHSEEGRKMRQRMSELTKRDKTKLKNMGYELSNSSTPEIYIYVGDNKLLVQMDTSLMQRGIFGAPFLDVAAYNKKLVGLRIFIPYGISEEDRDRVFAAFEEFSPIYNASRNQKSRSMVSIPKSLKEPEMEAKTIEEKNNLEVTTVGEFDQERPSEEVRERLQAINDIGSGLKGFAIESVEEKNSRYLANPNITLPNNEEASRKVIDDINGVSQVKRGALESQFGKSKSFFEYLKKAFLKAAEK